MSNLNPRRKKGFYDYLEVISKNGKTIGKSALGILGTIGFGLLIDKFKDKS